ncbi:hypothetical protein POV27_03300 [Aureisphaera galaxeae]|uniref:hypothetical protein n=1 Tax=Aureisphaera galaxeae TaxID=1538023 RepID=UPI002350211B|nr:hypothetical protein [Aureisphaera galaxeae]MDC8003060.1 hypothetical protein [Aureisphaera galaxeae]
MRILFLLCLVLFYGCAKEVEPTPEALIDQSIQVHGGWEGYENLDAIEIRKLVKLFDENGYLESQDRQYQNFTKVPRYKTRIHGIWGGAVREISYDGSEVFTSINDSIVQDSITSQTALKTIQSAEFVFFQPFKLRDSNAQMEYVGKRVLFDTIPVSEIKVNYSNSKDTWWFYFDEGNRCVANKVLHNGRYSLIENLEFQEYKGLLLHKHRKSYFVDSLLNKQYLRAEYFYDVVN